MAILGLLLLLAVGGLAVDVVMQNTASTSVEAVGTTFTMSPGWLFVAGLAAGVVGLVGLSLLVAGVTRTRRRRVAFAESRDSVQELEAERDRLAVELERVRAARTSIVGTTGAEDRRVTGDDDAVEIDLDEERRPAVTSDDSVAVRSTAGRERTDDDHRSGLFSRRH